MVEVSTEIYLFLVPVTVLVLYVIRKIAVGPSCTSTRRLDGQTVVITGADCGIGKETARDLAHRGARLVIGSHDLALANQVVEELRQETGNKQIVVHYVELASLKSVREFAEEIKRTESRLDLLINNAGCITAAKATTEDGYEYRFGVNYLSHFLLTYLLLDMLKKTAPSRIVTLSSSAHNFAFFDLDNFNTPKYHWTEYAYCTSKLCNILFTRQLAKKLSGTGVTTYAVHPSLTSSKIFENASVFLKCISILLVFFSKNNKQGAQTTLHCALDDSVKDHSGRYYSQCREAWTAPNVTDSNAEKLWNRTLEMLDLPDLHVTRK